MSRDVGVLRVAEGLQRAQAELAVHAHVSDAALLALMVARAADARCESRGGHFRTDHPAAAPQALRTLCYAHDALSAAAAPPQRRAS